MLQDCFLSYDNMGYACYTNAGRHSAPISDVKENWECSDALSDACMHVFGL